MAKQPKISIVPAKPKVTQADRKNVTGSKNTSETNSTGPKKPR